jgi:CDP-diglyceride synthetase
MELTASLLVGRSRARTIRYVVVAAGIFLGTLGLMGLVRVASRQGIPVPISGAWALWVAAIIAVGAPAVQAYQNDGLLVSLLVGLPIPLAFYLVLTTFNLVYPSEDVLWGIGAALQFGVPAGVLGFLLGIGGRRLRNRRATEGSESNAQ